MQRSKDPGINELFDVMTENWGENPRATAPAPPGLGAGGEGAAGDDSAPAARDEANADLEDDGYYLEDPDEDEASGGISDLPLPSTGFDEELYFLSQEMAELAAEDPDQPEEAAHATMPGPASLEEPAQLAEAPEEDPDMEALRRKIEILKLLGRSNLGGSACCMLILFLQSSGVSNKPRLQLQHQRSLRAAGTLASLFHPGFQDMLCIRGYHYSACHIPPRL